MLQQHPRGITQVLKHLILQACCDRTSLLLRHSPLALPITIRASDDARYLGRGLKRAGERDCEARLFDLGWGVELIAENHFIAFHSTGDFLLLALLVALGEGARKLLSLLFDNERYVQGSIAVPRPVNGAFPSPGDVGRSGPPVVSSHRQTEHNHDQQLIFHTFLPK